VAQNFVPQIGQLIASCPDLGSSEDFSDAVFTASPPVGSGVAA
jgi:hypothetical protein